MTRRKKPKFEEASVSLETLVSTPRVKKKSALETFVEDNFAKLLAAVEQGHPLGAICELLRKHGISSTPKLLRSALYNYAVEQNRLAELPAKLLPEDSSPEKPNSVSEAEPETFSLQQELETIPGQTVIVQDQAQTSDDDEASDLEKVTEYATSGWSEPKFNRNRVRPQ